jgi:hypothetical protein
MPEARLATRSESGDGKANRLPGFRLRSIARGSQNDRLSPMALLLAGLVLGSAAAGAAPQHTEPEANLAAHREQGRVVFDRLPAIGAAELVARGWLRWPGAPLELRTGGRTVATLHRFGDGAVEGRAGPGVDVPTSRVEPSWDDGAIHLILLTSGGSRFETGFFERVGAGATAGRLNRGANSIIDVRGTYQAVLRDPGDTSVGWLRVTVDPSDTPERSYEGFLPSVVAPELAAAATLALDSEIDWIEDHAQDVYRGS